MKSKSVSKGAIIGAMLASIIIGILFCALRTGFISLLVTIVGAMVVIAGIVSLFTKRIFGGIVALVVGILLIVFSWVWTEFVLIIFGAMMVISGSYGLVMSIKNKDFNSGLSSVLCIIIGGLLISLRWAEIIIFIVGALFILTGIIGVILICVPQKNKVKTVNVKDIK